MLKQLAYLKQRLEPSRSVYLDHNATTPVSRRARRSMNRVLKKQFGNPSSIYRLGRKSAALMEQAREEAALAMGANPGELYFTACATESNNLVLHSLFQLFHPRKKKILSSPMEHPSVIKTLEYLERQGAEVVYCPVDPQGRLMLQKLRELLDDQTFLVCVMLANNDIGTLQDIPAIVEIAHKQGALVLSDCVQALGKVPVKLNEWGVDYATFSAHKLYGPKGVGALFARNGVPLSPMIHGGSQEDGIRAGTESVHNIVGFGAACREVDRLLDKAPRMEGLKEKLFKGILSIRPDVVKNSPAEYCLPNTLNVSFPGLRRQEFMAVLDRYGIAVSAGSACGAKKQKASRSLQAIGVSDVAMTESIRISLGIHTTRKDIRHTLRILKRYFKGRIHHVHLVSAGEFRKHLKEDPLLLDVRPGFTRKNGKAPVGSLEIPFQSLHRKVDELPRDRSILVFCSKGNLSFLAAYYLKGRGFDKVGSLEGGLKGLE